MEDKALSLNTNSKDSISAVLNKIDDADLQDMLDNSSKDQSKESKKEPVMEKKVSKKR